MSNAITKLSTVTASSPAEVWKALITPTKLKQYFFGADIVSDWKVGSPIHMTGKYEGKPYEDKGEIMAFETEKRLSFSHWSALSGAPDTHENYRVITFDLAEIAIGTKVTLTQANLTGGVKPSDIKHKADHEMNWRAVLDGLMNVLAR